MRNFFLIFFLFISTLVHSIDYPFVPLQFSVGERLIRSLIEGSSNVDFSSVQWTGEAPQTITTIASGSNVLVSIVTSVDTALKKAAQNSTAGNMGSGTVVPTGSFLDAMQAVSLAQSGVFIQAMFSLLDFSGSSLFLYSFNILEGTTFKKYFDVSMLSMSTLQQIIDLKTSLNSNIPILNLNPLSSHDVLRRGNQFRYNLLYGCSGHPSLGSASLKSLYCMPGKVLYTVSVGGMYGTVTPSSYGFDYIYDYIKEDTNSVGYHLLIHHPNTQLDSPEYKQECSYSDESNCLPRWLQLIDRYGYSSYKKIGYWYHENPTALCPVGLVFDFGEWLNNKDFQYCKPHYEGDAVTPSYYDFNNLGRYPQFEIYNNVVYEHPYIADQKDSSSFTFSSSPEVSIFSGGQFISYVKRMDQNIFVDIAFQPFSDGFFISRTVNGLKLLRNGNIEVPIIIRDILKFSNDFKLIERGFSFVTQDGFDIAVGSTGLSPKTYGILGKTIAEQFGILTLSRDVVLPQQNTGNNQNNQNNQIVPCGLGKEVEVLRTRVNTQTGENENYYSKEPSPACNIAWGQVPEDNEESNTNQTKEEKERTLSDQIGGFFKDIKGSFSLDKSIFPTNDQCPPIEFDFRGIPLLKGEKKVFNQHCEEIAKNPILQSTLRFASMIGWFFLALIRVLRA